MRGQAPREARDEGPVQPSRWTATLAGLICAGCLIGGSGSALAKANLPELDLADADRCDFIADPGNRLCLLPFPNDYYTVRDSDTRTGRRVHLDPESMPANAAGVHIDPAPYNLNDGFSPGQPIVLRVPGIDGADDLRASGAVPINHIGGYKRRRQPIVLIDAETGKRRPIWAEIDSNATDREDVALQIHPAKNLRSRHRYIVALRNLRTAEGEEIPAPAGFRYFRDDVPSDHKPIERRRRHFERLFRILKRAGIARPDLYLAWDFTVASDRSIADRLLHMRDESFAELGDRKLANKRIEGGPPGFRITEVNEFGPAENAAVAREVRGEVDVPCYLAPDCRPGGDSSSGQTASRPAPEPGRRSCAA